MSGFELTPMECTVFFSFLHLRCLLPAGVGQPLSVLMVRNGREESLERQRLSTTAATNEQAASFSLEALIERDSFPDGYSIKLGFRDRSETVSCQDIVERERTLHARSILVEFYKHLASWLEVNPGRRPAMLDIGGRARSGYRYSSLFNQCDVVVADIVDDNSVDVVTDVHCMSDDLGCERFDFAICVSVFEHILMPWKAALEINKVMKPGGLVLIQTHQTVGLHDVPWDYYRFSDESWKGLFNSRTGFHIEHTLMASFQRIVPMHHYAVVNGFEAAGGFGESAVIARKVRACDLEWKVTHDDIVASCYPV